MLCHDEQLILLLPFASSQRHASTPCRCFPRSDRLNRGPAGSSVGGERRFCRVGGAEAPPLFKPDKRVYRIRLSRELSVRVVGV